MKAHRSRAAFPLSEKRLFEARLLTYPVPCLLLPGGTHGLRRGFNLPRAGRRRELVVV